MGGHEFLTTRRPVLYLALVGAFLTVSSPAFAQPVTFTDDFETDRNWGIFEEIVGGNPAYGTGLGEVARDTSPVHGGGNALHVWANKTLSDSSNHVIGNLQIANESVTGQMLYQFWVILPDTKLVQSGPEFSLQGTVDTAGSYLVRIAGLQYLPYCDTWNIWDSAAWVPLMNLALETGTWYQLQMKVDYQLQRYDYLRIQGGSIDTTIWFTGYRIVDENKGWGDRCLKLTLEAENLWTGNTWAVENRTLYDDVEFRTIPRTWFINDDVLDGNDRYTTATGSDTNDGDSVSCPLRTLAAAQYRLRAGDTVCLDAGTWAETLTINCDSITVLGVDSGLTILDYGDSSAGTGAVGILVVNCTGATIRDLRVSNSSTGIVLQNAQQARLSGLTLRYHGTRGAYLHTGSSGNTLENNLFELNGNSGCDLYQSNGNVLLGNLSRFNSMSGFGVNQSSNCTLRANQSLNNAWSGFSLRLQNHNGWIAGNVARNCDYGFYLESSSGNAFHQNTADSNYSYQVVIAGSASNNLIEKNVLVPSPGNPDSAAANLTDTAADLADNWWGTTDSAAIAARLCNAAVAGGIAYQPYRTGAPDTDLADDTIAPAAAGGLTADTSVPGHITIRWDPVTTSEDGSALTDGAGYRLYRAAGGGETDWKANAFLAAVSDTGFTDTGALAGAAYSYRVTAYDNHSPWENEGWFSDPLAATAPETMPAYAGPFWYVSADTGADSYNGSETYPVRTITRALALAMSGETVAIAPGTYAETVTIDTDGLFLIGSDSTTTILDPPGDSSTVELMAIVADTQTGITIANLKIIDAYYGLYLSDVDNAVLENLWVTATYNYAIYVGAQSDGVRVRNCRLSDNRSLALRLTGNNAVFENNEAANNGNTGVSFGGSFSYTTSNAVVTGNTITGSTYSGLSLSFLARDAVVEDNDLSGNSNSGLSLFYSDGNLVRNNRIVGNSTDGIAIDNGDSNLIIGNLISGNGTGSTPYAGIKLSDSNDNLVTANEITGNDTGITVLLTSTADTILKNNFSGNTENLNNSSADSHAFARNWYGTADSGVIRGLINYADTVGYLPFRLGAIDTAAGADTVAPAAPDSVTAVAIDTDAVSVAWTPVAANEEPSPDPVNLAGYRIWSAIAADSPFWNCVGEAPAGTTEYTDTNVPDGKTYYYRVTAFDNHSPWPNESYYSESVPAATTVNDTNEWYVNDTDLVGDIYTTDTGNDANSGASWAPFRTVTRALASALTGHVIYIDAGTYSETVTITVSGVQLVGKDSSAAGTVLDLADSATAGNTGLIAANLTGLIVDDLRIQNFACGIQLTNVTGAQLRRVTVHTNGGDGIRLTASDTNVLDLVYCTSNGGRGAWLANSRGNLVSAGKWDGNGLEGLMLEGCDSCTVGGGRPTSNGRAGVRLLGSINNLVEGIYHQSNGDTGILLDAGSHYNVINSNGGTNTRIALNGACYNTLYANTAGNGMSAAFTFQDAHFNVLEGDTANSSGGTHGIELYNSGGNLFQSCWSQYNQSAGAGYYLSGSDSNLFRNSVAYKNASHGFYLLNSANNQLTLCTADSNSGYGYYLDGTAAADTFTKCHYYSDRWSDSAWYINNANPFDLVRGYWGTTDSAAIRGKINGPGAGLAISIPFRLGEADTWSVTADTVAPRAPDTVAVTASGGQARVSWAEVTGSEEAEGALNLAGYRIYRAPAADTSYWARVGETAAGALTFDDTGAAADTWYWYRVTAFDNAAPRLNESFYSDSIIGVKTAGNTPVITVPTGAVTVRAGDTRAFAATATSSDTASGLTWQVVDTDTIRAEIQEGAEGDTIVLTAPAGPAGTTDTISIGVADSGGQPDTVTVAVTVTFGSDFDLDRDVDFDDLARLGRDYGQPIESADDNADITNDGGIDGADLLEFADDYGGRFE